MLEPRGEYLLGRMGALWTARGQHEGIEQKRWSFSLPPSAPSPPLKRACLDESIQSFVPKRKKKNRRKWKIKKKDLIWIPGQKFSFWSLLLLLLSCCKWLLATGWNRQGWAWYNSIHSVEIIDLLVPKNGKTNLVWASHENMSLGSKRK